MMHFSKKTIPSILFAALLSACGGQSATDTVSDSAVQKITQAVQTTQSPLPAPSSLMGSLAVAYPNGRLPAANAIQVAQELAQNPAALHLTAQLTDQIIENTSAPIQSQAVAADYKPVTRIQNTSLTGAYFFTIYDTECKTALANNYNLNLEGAAFWASLTPDAALNPVHRFRNVLNGSYLYTIYEAEKLDIITNYRSTFVYEGVAWYAKQTAGAGWSPLYRFRNLLNGTYLFSAFESEKNAILRDYSAVFKLEGVAYYVRQDGAGAVTNSVPAFNGTSLVTACGNVYFDPVVLNNQYPAIMNGINAATQSVKSAYGTVLSTQPDIIVCSSTACGTYYAGATLRNLVIFPGGRAGQYVAPRMTVVLISATYSQNPYILAHEFSHMEVNIRLNGARVPAWFDEGLATYIGGEPICTNVTRKGIASLLSLDSQAAWVTYTDNPAVITETYCQARAEVAAWVARRGTAAINQLLQAVAQGQSFTSQYGAMQTQ
jgi:Repeat of unknown function (DUF5648)